MSTQYRFLFLWLLVLGACRNNEPVPTTDTSAGNAAISDDSLRRFIVSTVSDTPPPSQHKLIELLSSLKDDSIQFRKTVAFLSKPFSDPNSSFRNEALYIQLLEAQLASEWYLDIEKEALTGKLHLALQNQVGDQANDFHYFTAEGKLKTMYDIQAPFTLLYFYNPECHSCQEAKAQLESSTIVNQNLSLGRLKLLAIYTDLDESLWRKHLPENPKQWLNGRDTGEYLWKNRVYDLRAIPTFYLLDKNKRVIVKDANLPQIEQQLQAK